MSLNKNRWFIIEVFFNLYFSYEKSCTFERFKFHLFTLVSSWEKLTHIPGYQVVVRVNLRKRCVCRQIKVRGFSSLLTFALKMSRDEDAGAGCIGRMKR